jgi:hypothetical protein
MIAAGAKRRHIMNTIRIHASLRAAVVGVALTLGTAAVFAESMEVHTRGANALNDIGREGQHTWWQARDASNAPQYTAGGGSSFLGGMWDKTRNGIAGLWHRTKSYGAQPAANADEPQRYGRAGGFIGVQQFEVPQPGVTTFDSAPANATAIKSGAEQ